MSKIFPNNFKNYSRKYGGPYSITKNVIVFFDSIKVTKDSLARRIKAKI